MQKRLQDAVLRWFHTRDVVPFLYHGLAFLLQVRFGRAGGAAGRGCNDDVIRSVISLVSGGLDG